MLRRMRSVHMGGWNEECVRVISTLKVLWCSLFCFLFDGDVG